MLKVCGQSLKALVSLPIVALTCPSGYGQTPRGPVLEERLLVGLRVKTKSDEKFIHRVVLLVKQKTLSVKLVDSTYFWARAKAARSRRLANNPMVYFRPALVARAAKLGIRL